MLSTIHSVPSHATVGSTYEATAVQHNQNPVIGKTRELIETLPQLPGVPADAPADEVLKHRNNLLACLDMLDKTGSWSCQQDDRSIRPVAVGLQAIYEQALLSSLDSGDVLRADILFTTMNPITPLCCSTAIGTPSLLSNSVASHPGSYDTVISRTRTVPQLLNHPAVNLCTVYSKERENPADQSIYDTVCLAHPDKSKFQSICTGINLPEHLSGANYFVVSKDNNIHLLGLRITQANKETDRCEIFTKDEQQRLKDLCDNYMDAIPLQDGVDENMGKFMKLLHQNYA